VGATGIEEEEEERRVSVGAVPFQLMNGYLYVISGIAEGYVRKFLACFESFIIDFFIMDSDFFYFKTATTFQFIPLMKALSLGIVFLYRTLFLHLS
jgi:hypothetical protein